MPKDKDRKHQRSNAFDYDDQKEYSIRTEKPSKCKKNDQKVEKQVEQEVVVVREVVERNDNFCKCCKCADCLEAACKPCDAPVANQDFNVAHVRLPKNLNFILAALSVFGAGSIARSTTVSADALAQALLNLGFTQAQVEARGLATLPPVVIPTSSSLGPRVPIGIPLTVGMSSASASTLILLESAILALNLRDPTVENIDAYLLENARLGLGIAAFDRLFLDYYIRLPKKACKEVDIELPLRPLVCGLISRINQRLLEGGTGVAAGQRGLQFVCCPQKSNKCNSDCNSGSVVTVDPFLNESRTGVLNVHVKLHIDNAGGLVKNFADVNLIQNTIDSDACKCENGDVVVDFNFYFLVFEGVLVSGFVYFSNGNREYALLSIDETINNFNPGLTCDNFVFNVPVLSEGRPTVTTTPTLTFPFTVTLEAVGDPAVPGTITALSINGAAITPSFYDVVTVDPAGAGVPTTSTATFNATYTDAATGIVIPVGTVITATSTSGLLTDTTTVVFSSTSLVTATFDPAVVGPLPINTPATTRVGPLLAFLETVLPSLLSGVTVQSIGITPVFTPGILLEFTPLCNDDCKNSYLVVNKSGFNL